MPTGKKMGDGFKTLITFALAPNIHLYETEVQPPGGDAGGPNDTTTMRNNRFRTKQPKKLITVTPITGVAQYAPGIYPDIMNQLGVLQLITVTFPDGESISDYGWLDKFIPQRAREGQPSLADFTIEISNQDAAGVEQAWTYAGASTTTAGTTTTVA
jgi:hypothetical protein